MSKDQLKIKATLYDYLKEGLKEPTTKKVEAIKLSFLLLLDNYFGEKLNKRPDLYDIEAFAGDMLYVINTPDKIKGDDPNLADALDIASDITYYFNKGKKNKNLEEFNRLIKYLRNYFESERKSV
ncbi:MAG: hypothetical protein UR98_C0018G0002 [Parcubacteria group bacterium GW2011_GWA1_36_12]|nr:MAG: hypothetical protein UR98_C0018G0002 [Parcubacteria group bacterium GW2011_GWA1_36_12]